ncbi:SPOR domain-containing protein [Burkholderia sp. BE17]|uniref:SPOR domain-containing protein n=1 Tax=Burkholderia sp. BE17 TaxID=2656644 RepID=UPI00128B5571|nr:SPOR domain-containing protein [Burkholderia sp. BE17]MPV71503.1 hypothetical protein [Burkholderia sp. BE17]
MRLRKDQQVDSKLFLMRWIMDAVGDRADNGNAINGRQRILIAGIGGIAPVFVSLIAVDLETLLLQVTTLAIAAYLIKVAVLFGIGGLTGWLHKSERDLVKIFQLGIVAPALITTALNGVQVKLPRAPSMNLSQSSWNMIASAYAQVPRSDSVKTFSLPQETPTQQISRGLFGSTPENVWFVIAGSHPTRAAAESQASKIRERGFAADVYAPYAGNKYYAVVIGAQLTLSQARQLRQNARLKGLPGDTYLWTFPLN